jgi:hypothetical protein
MVFEDGSVAQGQEPVSGGADGELVGGTDNFAQDPPEILTLTNLDMASSDLTGWSSF